MMLRRFQFFIFLFLGCLPFQIHAKPGEAVPAGWDKLVTVMEDACYHCHGEEDPEANLNLERFFDNPRLFAEYNLWNKVAEVVKSGEMPPKKPLAGEDKELLVTWLHRELDHVTRANAGDPGHVTVRRLTNVEYDNSVRDLTGIDFKLSADFLPDGGGGEGFSNVGDVLFVSPQQLDKYLSAARKLAEHATLLPGSGIRFQETRVGLRGPEQLRDQADQALYVWYQKTSAEHLPKDGDDLREADYMLACWQHKHRDITGKDSLPELAKEKGLHPAFLQNWWNMLNHETPRSRFLDLTRVAWRQLPGPKPNDAGAVPADVTKKIAIIQSNDRSWRDKRRVQRRQQDSDGLRYYDLNCDTHGKERVHIVVGQLDDGNRGDYVQIENLSLMRGKQRKREPYLGWLRRRLDNDRETLKKAIAENKQPAIETFKKRIADAEQVLAKLGRHPLAGKKADPNHFVVHAPAVLTLPLPEDTIRFEGRAKLELSVPDADFASAQWLSTTGTIPDPEKIIPGQLVVWKRSTDTHRSLMREFQMMKQAFPDEYNRRLEEITRNPSRHPDNPPGKGFYPGVYYFSDSQLKAMLSPAEQQNFARMQTDRRLTRSTKPTEKDQADWDHAIRNHLYAFAVRAWRRPLTHDEKEHLSSLYLEARNRDLDRESAAREAVVRTLISADFVFKLENASQPGEHPVSAWELATRLSYFLWSSPPDHELRRHAADGSLLKPEVLERETRRLLKDRRATNLAREFAGQWLQFHGFDKHATTDNGKFPEFTEGLRRDMHRETVEFFNHLIREDRPVTEILLADYTFLNERLAKHYGIPDIKGPEFRKISVSRHQRGGVLGMGSLLTKTSYPQRTSPVLRGDWLLHAVLGTPTPPPPANVPELDDNPKKPATLRARLEAHRADAACASCHDKIDPLGFALEAFDAIGRIREKDEAGQPIDNHASLADGTPLEGLQGLKRYLATRDKEFKTLLSRKLLGYALGRSFLATDKVLIESMVQNMEKSEDRFSSAVVALVKSRQFRNRVNE